MIVDKTTMTNVHRSKIFVGSLENRSRYLSWFANHGNSKFSFLFERSNLTSRIKDHLLKNLRNLLKNIAEKVWWWYSNKSTSYSPLKIAFWPLRTILTSEVKGDFSWSVWNWLIDLCKKFGKATLSHVWVISLFHHVITYTFSTVCTNGRKWVIDEIHS